jgi:four helix bundle protein
MSYRDFEIWKLARQVAIAERSMTLQNLPNLEMYEEVSQIRRSAKSISANIVEGYSRSRYKQEFIRFRTGPGEISNRALQIAHLVP